MEKLYKKKARLKELQIKGETVQVTFVRLPDGRVKISDA
ncbi:polymorphic toxin type 35 domain-containing protein [Paludifilum halophilum]